MQQPRPQLRRPLGTYTREAQHPSRGGNPYTQDMREEVITRHQLGLPIVTPEIMALCQQYQYPSEWTCRRYIRQFNASGHARPKYATGNHMANRQVLGQHLVRLALLPRGESLNYKPQLTKTRAHSYKLILHNHRFFTTQFHPDCLSAAGLLLAKFPPPPRLRSPPFRLSRRALAGVFYLKIILLRYRYMEESVRSFYFTVNQPP